MSERTFTPEFRPERAISFPGEGCSVAEVCGTADAGPKARRNGGGQLRTARVAALQHPV